MADLLVGATAIWLAADGAKPTFDEIGTRERMIDGEMLETIIARKRVFACVTPLVTEAEADTYVAALQAAPPLACNGAALKNQAVNCFAKVESLIPVPTRSGLRWRLAFTLYEA